MFMPDDEFSYPSFEDYFELNENNGVIRTKQSLDYEAFWQQYLEPEFHFEVDIKEYA